MLYNIDLSSTVQAFQSSGRKIGSFINETLTHQNRGLEFTRIQLNVHT